MARFGEWLERLGRLGRLEALGEALGRVLYPPHCTLCLVGTRVGCHLCTGCEGRVRLVVGARCRQCSRPFPGAEPLPERCADCVSRQPAYECAVAAYNATGVVREVVHQFKYNGKRYLAGTLADWMALGLGDSRLVSPAVDMLIPVPLYPGKLRQRGFNQALLLAEEVHRRSRLPMVEVLARVRDTGTQTRLQREARLGNLRGAFGVRPGRGVENRHVLLIDDVLTTGATLEACASVLKKAGAASVRALTVARG
jgi:competence protein ComFC